MLSAAAAAAAAAGGPVTTDLRNAKHRSQSTVVGYGEHGVG